VQRRPASHKRGQPYAACSGIEMAIRHIVA
jgi:hypothetical protein